MSVTINGTSGLVFNDASTQATAATGFGFKNRIINGAMTIDQRNAGASVTVNSTTGTYVVDRFFGQGKASAGVFTLQQSSTAPDGFSNSILATVTTADASLTATAFYEINQQVEGFNVADFGFGAANASTITLSFWVRSSVTGTFGGALRNGDANRSYPFSYTVNAANTFEQKTITVAGDTTGTWLKTNGLGMRLTFSLGESSDRKTTAGAWVAGNYASSTGSTNLISTNGATFYITGVQLEKGSTATSFDYRPYGTELALCQRYYFQYVNGNNQSIGIGTYYTSTSLYSTIQTPVTMRAKPTLSSTTGTDFYTVYRSGVSDGFNSLSLDGYEHINGAVLRNTTEVSGTAGQSGFISTTTSSSALALSAEL